MRSLIPWKPLREMGAMQRRVEDMFEHCFGPWERERPVWNAEIWTPEVESRMSNGTIVIKAALPGIDPREVSISVTENQLNIKGERKQEGKKRMTTSIRKSATESSPGL